MNRMYSIILALCVLLSAGRMSAQEITKTEIPVSAVKIVNLQERANYELAHPRAKHKRFVEQGEDREKEFRFIPKPVGADAIHFDLPAPEHQHRAVVNSPAPSISFNGTQDNGTLIPPDIRGAVGPGHVMETTNQEFKIYTKAGSLVSTVSITTFFASTGGSGYFDPHLLYDATNGRWLVCIDGNVSNGHGGMFVGVSQTSDPTGSWYVYSFDGIGNSTDFLDYPLMGYNTNWVVITGNDFLASGAVTGKIYVMNRASMYSGSLGTVSSFTDANVFSLAPAQTYDASQTTLYMVEDWNGNSGGSGFVRIGSITGTASAPVYNSGTTIGVSQPWSETSVTAPQSGSTNKIESGDTRIGNAVYINGSLWFCQTVFLPATSPTRDAVQWWQVNPATQTVQQFGRVDGGSSTGTFYFYPSIAVNSSGDMMLGHCQSSNSTFAGASYSTRAAADAVNTTQTPYLYKAGLASYYKTFSGTRNRWGDYTGAAVDPSDNSFWNVSEWANTSNKWGTIIARVALTPVVPCTAVTGLTTSAVANNSATFNWTASSGAVSYNVQYRAVGAASWTSANTTSTSYSVLALTAGNNYEWQVQTVCSTGTSAYTASATFTTTGVAPCNTPASLSTSAITTTTATFTWGAVTGAVSYAVRYRIVGAATWNSGTSTTTSYSATGLTATSNYEWQVSTVCSASSSAFSSSATFATATPSTCSDVYESNNSSGTAKTAPLNANFNGFITPSTDVDWFKFTTVSPNIKVKVDLTTLPADYDVKLYSSNASTQLGISQNGGTTSEQIKYNATGTGTYYVKVYGYGGATSASLCYTLRVSVGSTAWAPEYATDVIANDKPDIIEAEPVMKVFPNPAKDKVTVEFLSDVKANVRLNIYNLSGEKVLGSEANAEEGLNTQTLNTNTLSSGVYIFEVYTNGEAQRQKFTIAK